MKSRKLIDALAAVTAMGLIVTPEVVQKVFAQGPPVTTAATGRGELASWENLRQLSSGQKIQVVQKDMKSWTGSFAGVSDESVSLKVRHAAKAVSRADVLRVSRPGGRRLRNALIGAAIGGGAGVAAGAAAFGCRKNSFVPCIGRGAAAAIIGGTGVVIGGGVGAAIPGSTVIYRAPVK